MISTSDSLFTNISNDKYQSQIPLLRSISSLRWWCAVITLEENPDINECSASHQHNEWTWRLVRTSEKGIYLQNTYFNNNLMCSEKMKTTDESCA